MQVTGDWRENSAESWRKKSQQEEVTAGVKMKHSSASGNIKYIWRTSRQSQLETACVLCLQEEEEWSWTSIPSPGLAFKSHSRWISPISEVTGTLTELLPRLSPSSHQLCLLAYWKLSSSFLSQLSGLQDAVSTDLKKDFLGLCWLFPPSSAAFLLTPVTLRSNLKQRCFFSSKVQLEEAEVGQNLEQPGLVGGVSTKNIKVPSISSHSMIHSSLTGPTDIFTGMLKDSAW